MVNYLGEKYDVSATMGIEPIPGGVLFTLAIDNATRYRVGEVLFPILGGLQGVGETRGQLKATQFIMPKRGSAVLKADIFRVFKNNSWLGDQGPEQIYHYGEDIPKPWVEFFAPELQRSVSIRAYDPASRPKVLRLELLPGNSSTVREDGNWPRPDELKGLPVGMSLCFVEFPNVPPHKPYKAPAVLISFHVGDWHEAATAGNGQGKRDGNRE